MISASCNCGVVRFELTEAPSTLGACYCSRCRKAGASAMVFIKKESLNWVSGQDQIAVYRPQQPYKYKRCFCKICGTSLGEVLSEEASFPVSANVFDGDLGLQVQFEEHVEDKPSWME
ncbi:hypothetical protein BXY66_0785 [Shimia isoporae]|uniref:CENP-V/GFA domain-containing protein n=1 Tax=Shimia isoporae TaxID=647720 RepID=A0A4R1NKB6_9RHOB|nr:GFA family protein [Shimia isoporae]TCL08747.1 hypothetical protein BXY66_0785 [Shimia isoporae]